MITYINTDRLRAEIENLIEKYSSVEAKGPILEGYKSGRLIGYRDTINKLNSLQQEQPDIDLEKFISDFIDKKDSENQGKWCEEDIIEAMKSSFDLGLNARKEE